MTAMQAVGNGHRASVHARVHEATSDYVITLDVPGFAESELTVEALGRTVTVRGEQLQTLEDEGRPFRLRERFEESFRLPDDAVPDRTAALFRPGTLEIRAPRTRLEPRLLPIEHPHLIHAEAEAC